MVTEPFVETCEEGQFDGHGQRHRTRRQLGRQRNVEFVELVVDVLNGAGRLEFVVDDHVSRLAPNSGGDLAHALDQAPAARRHLTAEASGGASRDVLGEIAVAFDLGKDPQQSEESAPLVDVEARVLEQSDLGRLDDRVHEVVDLDVLVDDAFRQFAIAREQGVGRAGYCLADQGEDAHNLGSEFLTVARELGRVTLGFGARSKEAIHGQRLPPRYRAYLGWGCHVERDWMIGVIAGLGGLALGVAVTWALSQRRAQALRDELAALTSDLAVRASQLAAANDQLARQRIDHAAAIENLEQTFENLSNRVLAQTVAQFNLSQEEVGRLRESKLDSTLKPLETLLGEYKKNLADFNTQNAGALADVKSKAEELLGAQQRTQDETKRLNQLLGRSSQRGAWGEIQLANVMVKSGLREEVDFELQVTGSSGAGRVQRPDCVVNLPNGIRLAVDAKFPFAAFEESLDTEDGDARRELMMKHARDLRGHVKALREKGYWEGITPAPEFTVCFVPSDAAIAAAFEADPQLHADAAHQRVVIAGPTTLLSLLWSVAVIVQQHQVAVNAEQIYQIADKIFDRIRNVAEPVAKMGKSIDATVRDYNSMLSSIEGRLIPAARSVRQLGGAKRAKELPELEAVDRLTTPMNDTKWGVSDDDALPEGAFEILELEAFEELVQNSEE